MMTEVLKDGLIDRLKTVYLLNYVDWRIMSQNMHGEKMVIVKCPTLHGVFMGFSPHFYMGEKPYGLL